MNFKTALHSYTCMWILLSGTIVLRDDEMNKVNKRSIRSESDITHIWGI